ncbi:proliferation marker protein Ki-67 isoform X2 [Pleuronectes platessa]|uniref:proliferation marker protein Ki-67 isoform X2 n=1 Tax=Pleuronectes platessa TaxID=8262 RepID=UPI00232A43DF|nr:proliferation marker protein Ki-67 isoform X2 [Pleuronectes platessa]
MPLHGKIVVIKRSGGDGTEFPLTATCMFGRKPDCDIRIQLPQVSKEHCRIDLNENKEVVLTNLSSVNPTRINGEALQQSERLKHGDVITVIDRSFRFEYPPAPTPKKRASAGGKSETLKVLQDQQVVDTLTVETGDKKLSEVFTDGTNHDNIRRTLDNTVEVESKEDATQLQNKTNSPFNDLYQMIKKSLDVKTPRKSSASLLQTPASKFCTPKPASVRKSEVTPVIFKQDQGTPKMKNEAKVTPEADKIQGKDESCNPETPKSVKKQRKSSPTSSENPGPAAEETDDVIKSEKTSPQRRTRVTPQKLSAAEVMKQVCVETPKSPVRRSSRETTPVKSAVTAVEPEPVQRKSPRNSGKAEQVNETTKKRKGGKLAADLPTSQMKRKRVSFGGALSPELFDKRLPPNSPLCKGAFPRRSLCLNKPNESLLRRASVIGLLKPKASSPGKKSPNSRSSSPKAASPGKKSPKSATPAKKSPKTPSPVRGSSPTVQGRFSVSRISTPSPVTEDFVTCTPKIPLNRKSMKSTSRKTPIIGKSTVKGIRRSGISRASMKVKNSWVDIVKFGQPKAQVIAPVIKMVTKKTTKKIVSKPQTPARNIKGHVSTGHADSPATIIVGRAHTQSALQPSGAAPRVVTNIALLKKNMKMDEDLTGISQMYKTPVNEKKKRSGINKSVDETPVGVLGTSVVEPSILNTPEGPGEMVVSPLNLASTVKDRSYNSDAVQRLLNEDKDSSFVSVIPALEIPSDESSEQQSTKVETSPVKTPKRKPEQPECLSGKLDALEADDVSLCGVEEPQETPAHVQESEDLSEMADVKTLNAKSSPVLCLEKELDFANEDLQEDKPLDVIDVVPQVDAVKAVSDEVVNDKKEEPSDKESSDVMETVSQAAEDESLPEEQPEVNTVKNLSEEQPEVEAVVEEQPEVEAVVEEQPEVEAVVEEQPEVEAVVEEQPKVEAVVEEQPEVEAVVEEQPEVEAVVEEQPEVEAVVEEQPEVEAVVEEQPEVEAVVEEQPEVEAVVEEQPEVDAAVAPVQEKKPVRGRRAKTVEPEAVEDKQDAAQHSEEPVTPAPVRGRRGKKTETPAPSTVQKKTRSRNAKTTESNDADLKVEESTSQPPKIEAKPKRGRNAKKASDDQAEMVATETENAPEAECEQIPAVEVDDESAAPQEKTAPKLKRARKPKQETEPSQPEQQGVAKEHSEDPVVPAPVKGRRGKKTEATAAPAVRQTTRTRNFRSQGNASDDKPEAAPEPSAEMQPEIPSEAESEQTAPPAEEAVVKPVRGRKTKPTPVAPPQPEPENAQVSDEPQQHIPTVAITRRGRKIKSDTTEQTGAAEDTLVTVETKQESQPPVRVKRGRNAKQEEEKQETSDVQEPVKKTTRTRKTKEERVKPVEEEIKTDETVVPEEAGSLLVAEPLEMNEQVPVTEKKNRRGGKKAKQAAESETPVESTEVEEVPAVKPKRGKRVKEATEVVAEVPEAEEKTAEPDAPVVKPTRARGVKTVKNQVSEVIPAKRARRVAATLPEDTESTALDLSVPAAEPAKRGKRAAAKPTSDELTVSSDQVNTSEELTSAVTEDVKGSKRSVKLKADREVLQIPKATPVKAVRGKKSKLVDAESKSTSNDADKTEEKDLSEEVVEAQPVKRARRVKVTEETADPKKDAEAETQPKTRRARTNK